jgi:CRP/FNR family transcriptional regulator, cyclic AMP receptor protein
MEKERQMKGPYGFELNDDCQNCKLRGERFFCQLATAALKDLNAIRFTSAYPAGAVLFIEKQTARGIYVLCEGEVKLSISSSEGKKLILRIAKAGEVLGLVSALAGTPHEVTVETLRPCQVAFIPRDAFLRFLSKHPEVYPKVAGQLGAQYQVACEQLRNVALSASAPEKLAKLLLDFATAGQHTKEGTRIKLPLTHEEIAEFIGTTRETVTRTLSEFKSHHLVELRGSTLVIGNREALEELVTV